VTEIIDSIIESSKIVSSPISEPMKNVGNLTSTDDEMPLLAEMLNLTAFYTDSAKDVFNIEVITDIQNKVSFITEYAKNSIRDASEPKIIDFISELISTEEMQDISPIEKLEKVYLNLKIKEKLKEVERLRSLLGSTPKPKNHIPSWDYGGLK